MASSETWRAPAEHAVHLVARLDEHGTAPERMRFGARLERRTRGLALFGMLLLAAFGGVVVWDLWSGRDSLPAGVTLLFSAFVGVLLLAAFVGLDGSRRLWRRQTVAARRWAALRNGAVAEPGTVVDRRIVPADQPGTVAGFEVLVETPHGRVAAGWRASSAALLEGQVPEVGTPVRLWRAAADGPVVVEVADPTVGTA